MSEPPGFSKERLESFIGMLLDMAAGRSDLRLPISESRDQLDAIAFGINILADEVEYRFSTDAARAAELKSAMTRLELTLAELRETQAQLIQSAKMAALGEFSSGLAHEINNPLTIIRAYTEEVEDMFKHKEVVTLAEVEPHFRKINTSIDRVAKTVKHVNEFSRKADGVKSVVPLNELVSASLEFTQVQLQRKKIQLQVYLDPASPMIEADGTALEHVILNMISNASDAIEARHQAGGGAITIQTRVTGPEAIVSIQDNGSGIDPAVIEKMYQPFFTTKPPGRGTGLGLSISYQIMTAHNGQIECDSQIGEGTTFTLRLPVC